MQLDIPCIKQFHENDCWIGGDQAKILEMIQKSKEVYKMYTTDALVDIDSVDISKLPTKPMIVTHLPVRATKGNF